MADIPVSTVVTVTIGTSPTFPSRAGFGTINIVGTSTVINAQVRAVAFANLDAVATFGFATTSEEYKAATVAFAQSPSPQQVIISRRVIAALPPEIRGGSGPTTTIATWQAITDGSFELTMGGISNDITAVDFSADTTLTDVAATVQTAIRSAGAGDGAIWTAATCTYSASENRFFVRGGTTGATETIAFATAQGAGTAIEGQGFLEIDSANAASRSNGLDPDTIAGALTAINTANSDWYAFAFTNSEGFRDNQTQVLAAANWAEARVKVFMNDSDDGDILDTTVTNDIASVIQDNTLRRTMTCYNGTAGQYLAVSAFARASTVNFNGTNTTITLKFKQMPGITRAALRIDQKQALDSKNANAYFTVGGNPMFGESFMGNGVFFDEVHGIDWLQNAIETNVFGTLYTSTTKIPMTDPGTAVLQQRVEAGLEQGRINGLLAPGTAADGEFLPKGYRTSVLPIADHDVGQRQNRIGPPITFTALGAGAIHNIAVNGTFER